MRPLTATSLALALCLGGAGALAPVASQAQVDFGVGVSVGFAPPPLPYYDQPSAPGYGYIWTPGYWAWDDYAGDYYWVPGTWVLPPRIGLLWTPPWWGWNDGAYVFNAGYWGPTVGFYGGINYGFGYTGFGYEGGYWRDNQFFYNRTVNNINNVNITNVYNRPINTVNNFNRVSFNGPGGVQARPTNAQLYAARAPHLAPTSAQQQHFQLARNQPDLRAGANHGAPPIAATARPAMLRGPGVAPAVRAGGAYHPQTGAYRAPGDAGAPAAQRYGQGPVSRAEGFSGGARAPGSYNGAYNNAYRQAQPRYGQASGAPERFNNPAHLPGGYDSSYNAGYRTTPRAAESYNSGYPVHSPQARPPQNYYPVHSPQPRPPQNYDNSYRPPAAGYSNGYRAPSRPTEAFNAGGAFRAQAPAYNNDGYRSAPRPAGGFNSGGGFRAQAPAPQAMERAAPQVREARPAPAPAPQAQHDRKEPPRPN
jgi:hypothetical protein